MSEQKQYLPGVWIREKQFANGGSVLNVSVKREAIAELAKLLNEVAAESGWARLVISGRKTPDEKSTHSIYVDTWKPTGQAKAKAPDADDIF